MSKDQKTNNDVEENIDESGLEKEPSGEDTIDNPWDPSKIRVDSKSFSLRNILDMLDEEDLILAPDFQRNTVWNKTQKTRLIESILLRIPLPAFYFSQDNEGKYQVIDGLQRLSAIYEFVRGGKNKDKFYALDDLEYLQKEVGRKSFADIEGSMWPRRINSTQINVNVVDPQTPPKVKFDIFKRINTGGTILNSQEIRHCMSHQRSRKFLKELAESRCFSKATDCAIKTIRMADREIVLRFCAFYISFFIENSLEQYSLDSYTKAGTMDAFLTEATEKIDHELDENALSLISSAFKGAMNNAHNLFGQHAFRKWPAGEDRRYPINRALFEIWSVALANYEWDKIKEKKNDIVRTAREMMATDMDFISAISSATSMSRKVKIRFENINNIFKSYNL